MVMNVHGHVHEAPGQDEVGNVPILNPGSLSEGRFSLVELRRGEGGGIGGAGGDAMPGNTGGDDAKDQRLQHGAAAWKVVGVRLHELPDLLKLGRKPYSRSSVQ